MFFRELLLLLFAGNFAFSFVNKPIFIDHRKINALEKDSDIYIKFEKYSRENNYDKQHEYLRKIMNYLNIRKEFDIYENKLLNDEDVSDCPICIKNDFNNK
jgi:hypothetical protein